MPASNPLLMLRLQWLRCSCNTLPLRSQLWQSSCKVAMVAALSQGPVVNAVAFWMYDSRIERAAFRSVIETFTNFEIEIALA